MCFKVKIAPVVSCNLLQLNYDFDFKCSNFCIKGDVSRKCDGLCTVHTLTMSTRVNGT